VASELRKYFGQKLCRTSIPRNIRLAEAPSHGKPALVYDVRSRGAESYIRLAKEILDAEAARRQQAEAAAQALPVAAPPEVPAEAAPSASDSESPAEAGTQAAAPAPVAELDPQPAACTAAELVSESKLAAPVFGPAAVSLEAASAATPPTSPVESMAAAAAERLSEPAAQSAIESAPSPPEAYPSLPPPALAEAVIQAAQAPEAQPAVEQGD
jgi:chromosome partitioning protein